VSPFSGRPDDLLPVVLERSKENRAAARKMTPAEARAVLDAVAAYPWPPYQRATAARDHAVMLVAAEANLHGRWLARLCWRDVCREPMPAIALTGGPVSALVLVDDEVIDALQRWRSTLEAIIGRAVIDDEPVFPQLGHWPRGRLGSGPLRPMVAMHFAKVVRATMTAVGLRAEITALYSLRGVLGQAGRGGRDTQGGAAKHLAAFPQPT
jgi:hypothetical protein